MEYSLFDMHIHSTASDGTDTPAQIVKKVREMGINTFCLTDHDNTEGVKEILNSCDLSDLDFYTGIEFSCRTGKLCHILGYGFDIHSDSIADLVRQQKNRQNEKMKQRLAGLESVYGITFCNEDLKWLSRQNRAGKPHLAQLLIKNGYAENTADAFKKYHNNIHPNVPELPPQKAIDAIKQAGGVAIWAHPLGGEGETHLSEDKFLKEAQILLSTGIDGIECFYSRYTDREIQFLTSFAKDNNLLISGGSDYHGENKDISLGQLGSKTPEYHNQNIQSLLNLLKQRDI